MQPVTDNVLDPKKEQLVEQAIREKALSKACMLLTSSDSPITVDVPTEMKKLHPDGDPFDLDYIPGQLNLSSSDVESKLKEFPPGSSGGPSGWRGSHLKEMLKAKCKPSFLSALTAFCTRIANGSFSKECLAVITAARLVPVGKASGGLRPIAVGDVFRRLAGKLLMESVVAKTTEHLRPEQIGVQAPNAAQTAARKVRLWTQDAKRRSGYVQRVWKCRSTENARGGQKLLPVLIPVCRCLLPQSQHSFGRRVRFRIDAWRTTGRRPWPRPFCYCPTASGGAPPRTSPRTPPVVPGRWHPRWDNSDHQSCAGPSAGAAPKCKLFGPGASDGDAAFEGIPRYSLDEGTVVFGCPHRQRNFPR